MEMRGVWGPKVSLFWFICCSELHSQAKKQTKPKQTLKAPFKVAWNFKKNNNKKNSLNICAWHYQCIQTKEEKRRENVHISWCWLLAEGTPRTSKILKYTHNILTINKLLLFKMDICPLNECPSTVITFCVSYGKAIYKNWFTTFTSLFVFQFQQLGSIHQQRRSQEILHIHKI